MAAGSKSKGKGAGEGKAEVVPLRPTRPCPICGKPSTRGAYPFCSKHCADVDLNRWLTGRYAIPVVEEDSSPEDGEAGEE